MLRKKLNILKLRLKYALIMLFDKEFYHKMRAYKKLDKYTKIIEILSKGRLSVDRIRMLDGELSKKIYACDVTYTTMDAEACFDFRRQCFLNPGYFSIEDIEELELCK